MRNKGEIRGNILLVTCGEYEKLTGLARPHLHIRCEVCLKVKYCIKFKFLPVCRPLNEKHQTEQ